MQTTNNKLIDELLAITETCSRSVQNFQSLPLSQLNFKKDAASWSILECIEHLNLYGDFYLPEIEKQMALKKTASPVSVFKAGMLGNYFANLMQLKPGKIKKMKSPKDKNPAGSQLTGTTLDRFLKQQALLTELLNKARTVDLMKTKTAISLTSLIKLRLGDTFRFFVYHIERHVAQAEKVLTDKKQ